MIKFESFGKIPRLFRDVVVTEKIDGTNGAIGIWFESFDPSSHPEMPSKATIVDRGGFEISGMVNLAFVYAQSRSRVIYPSKDNFGFAKWVYDNAESLVADLGEGLHFGEWWGSGIQRGYGLDHKRFSLFNVKRWEDAEFTTPDLLTVPVLSRGEFSTLLVRGTLEQLRLNGSSAAPGFMKPEGVMVYHTAGNLMFKATLENDEQPKTQFAKGGIAGVRVVSGQRDISTELLADKTLSTNAIFHAAKLIGDVAA